MFVCCEQEHSKMSKKRHSRNLISLTEVQFARLILFQIFKIYKFLPTLNCKDNFYGSALALRGKTYFLRKHYR